MALGGTVDAVATRLPERTLPRYRRPHEEPPMVTCADSIPYHESGAAIAASPLSAGSKLLLAALLRLGSARVFPGGGVGIEYASLLKTAARPDALTRHAAEAAAHLHAQRADVLFVPGMSGYPPGAFVIPSYTGEGDVVMSVDQDAAQDVVDAVVAPQLAAQHHAARPVLTVRAAGADDIIDKATMSCAVGESAVVVGRAAIADFVRRHRAATGDDRPIAARVEVVGWVTPLIKGYNRPQERLQRAFGLLPFAGLNVTSVHLDPPAIGVEGVGVLGFAPHPRG